MIIGTGIDLVDSNRIQTLLDRHENRFFEKYFTANETKTIQALPKDIQVLSLAKRFAAKEACAKALGTGFRNGIVMRDMEISNDALGKPIMTLSGGAQERLDKLAVASPMTVQKTIIHLSLTDEPPYAQAQIIIEAL